MEATRQYMADPKNNAADDDATESRMRLALGLRGPSGQPVQQRADQARARHKFVQDGGVPVVVLNSRGEQDSAHKARITELEGQLDIERTQHAATRRALQEAQAATQGLQTRLAHAELAHRDALLAAQQALEAAVEQTKTAAPLPTPRKVVRKSPIERLPRDKEPKPVKWWTPTYRAKTKAK